MKIFLASAMLVCKHTRSNGAMFPIFFNFCIWRTSHKETHPRSSDKFFGWIVYLHRELCFVSNLFKCPAIVLMIFVYYTNKTTTYARKSPTRVRSLDLNLIVYPVQGLRGS